VSGRHESGSRRRGPHPDSAVNDIQNVNDLPDLTYYVLSETWEDAADEPSPADWNRDRFGDLDRRNPDIRCRRSDVLAARKIAPGALRDSYDIPEVTFSRKEGRGLLLTTMLVAGWVSWHLGYQSLVLLACTAPATVFRALGFVLSWFDRPVATTLAGQERLNRLHVTIAVPVYNEDPGLLDRCIFAMVNQSRPAQLIWVVDDGSMTDYSAVAQHWVGTWSNGTEVRWSRQPNQGKRQAHAKVFERVPEADIFVTVDSDTTLERRALEEGLKPFQSRKVMSVAGIEMGFNANVNLLTRLQSSLQLYAQAVIGAAWSVAGDMYTNRGPFALYRAPMVREFLPVYRDETFFGRRVVLGDDSLLALCASARGRSVQQLSAFGMTMWPEKVGHHLRQRLRWARGRAVRNFWRIRYRPVSSYCWWFTASGIHGFLLSGALIALLMGLWPVSADVITRAALVLAIMAVPNGLRTLCFRRSDETWRDRLLLVLIRPLSALWSGIVLARIIRLAGTVTLLRQSWTTRKKGAELVLGPEPATTGVLVTVGSVTSGEAVA
jgi:hyaluronan synthase